MSELTKALSDDKKLLAEKMAGPLAKLLSAQGKKMTEEEAKALILDEKTIIEIPKFVIKAAGTTTTTTETTTTTTTEYV